VLADVLNLTKVEVRVIASEPIAAERYEQSQGYYAQTGENEHNVRPFHAFQDHWTLYKLSHNTFKPEMRCFL
jgi:hypothetical protein